MISSRGRRVERNPVHTFQLEQMPFQIQPFMLAPVLPGETMKNLTMQSRVVTDPIKNPLTGWWCEHYFFYVKHRDMEIADELVNMMIDPENATLTSSKSPLTGVQWYSNGTNEMKWMYYAIRAIVEEYFRDESEHWYTNTSLGGLPLAAINSESFLQSIADSSQYGDPTVNVDENADGTITAQEVDAALRNWQVLRMHNLTDMSYEDYLATHGVKQTPAERNVPELLRYSREWQYPTNTVNPANGTPTSACSWSVSLRADKDRYFKEPGFVIGVSVVRPKVYLGNQSSSAANVMDTIMSWLPAVMSDDIYSSLKLIDQADGPIKNGADTGGYWLDIKDLFLYGDQYINFATTATNKNLVALPTPDLQRRFVSQTDINNLFVAASSNKVRQDGVVALRVHGHIQDTTPGMAPTV